MSMINHNGRTRFRMHGGAFALAALLSACNGDFTAISNRHSRVTTVSDQLSALNDCTNCIFGPASFTRTTGKPVTRTSTFDGDPSREYVIDIDDAGSLGADGSVALNGTVLLAPRADGEQATRHIRQSVSLDTKNTLVVRLTGRPGSELSVWIEDVTPNAVEGVFLIEQLVPSCCERLAKLVLPAGTSTIVVPGPSGQGDLSYDGSQLVYWRPFDNRIFRSAADGTGEVVIASGAISYGPRWSRAGDRIAYTREIGLGESSREVCTMNPDGTGFQRLTTNGSIDEAPDLSPDGSKVVFVSTRDGNEEIYVMNSDGTGQTRLTTAPGHDRGPSWSPDGTRIAFTSDRSGALEIFTMNPEGSNVVQVTSGSGNPFSQTARWSPTGHRLAFVRTENGVTAAWTIRPDGLDARLLRLPSSGITHEYVKSWRAN